MAKRGVEYVKPEEPDFIKKLKVQAGHEESDDVNTKFEQTHEDFDERDKEDEEPQVVVLKPGDLTAEEVKKIKESEDDKLDGKADLSQKVIFNPKVTKSNISNNPEESDEAKSEADSQSKIKKKLENMPVLSFDYENEESD